MLNGVSPKWTRKSSAVCRAVAMYWGHGPNHEARQRRKFGVDKQVSRVTSMKTGRAVRLN
jgi:hypothetical protein